MKRSPERCHWPVRKSPARRPRLNRTVNIRPPRSLTSLPHLRCPGHNWRSNPRPCRTPPALTESIRRHPTRRARDSHDSASRARMHRRQARNTAPPSTDETPRRPTSRVPTSAARRVPAAWRRSGSHIRWMPSCPPSPPSGGYRPDRRCSRSTPDCDSYPCSIVSAGDTARPCFCKKMLCATRLQLLSQLYS